MNYVLTDIE